MIVAEPVVELNLQTFKTFPHRGDFIDTFIDTKTPKVSQSAAKTKHTAQNVHDIFDALVL